MTRSISASTLLFLTLAACNRSTGTDADGREPRISAARPAEQDKIAADNSKMNEGAREAAALAPGDRAETAADRATLVRVRDGLTREKSLAMPEKNVSILTNDGVITLRGRVKTASDRMEIGRIAQGSEGVREVDNQLEVSEDATP